MDKTIARLNIGHFRQKLTEEADTTKRQTLAQLLAEEEAKLAAALDGPPANTPSAIPASGSGEHQSTSPPQH